MINVIVGVLSFGLGFVAAYAFDTFLAWRDDRRWR